MTMQEMTGEHVAALSRQFERTPLPDPSVKKNEGVPMTQVFVRHILPMPC